MQRVTTIQVHQKVLKELRELKDYDRQSYSELIQKMIHILKESRKPSQYDSFLHHAQSKKMKELWDNPADEAWENA